MSTVASRSHFSEFAKLCADKGLLAVDCGRGHWQILEGACRVNFYPTSKRRSVYVQGTQYGENDCTAARAIDLAIDGPPKRWLTKRKDSYARQRRSMLRWKPFCHWCERGLTESTATVDHIVPLSRGGSNYRNNLVLACGPCNAKRADSCGAPKSE